METTGSSATNSRPPPSPPSPHLLRLLEIIKATPPPQPHNFHRLLPFSSYAALFPYLLVLAIFAPSHGQSLILYSESHCICVVQMIENGDTGQWEGPARELAELLGSVSESIDPSSDSRNKDACDETRQMLDYILEYVRSPSAEQAVIDAMSFVLPEAVCKFSGASPEFLVVAESIIQQLVSRCDPREMLAILCEALDSQGEKVSISLYLNPLLGAIPRVLLSIKRRQYEQIRVASPVILQALQQASLGLDEEDENLQNLFDRAIGIAGSINDIQQKLEGALSDKLQALLCLYILQIVTYISISIGDKVPRCLYLVSQLSGFFNYSQLSLMGLLSGSAISDLASYINEEEDDTAKSCFPNIELGASLSVLWCYIANNVAQSAKETWGALENELRCDQIKRWQAIGMLKHIFSSADLPWSLKKHAIEFLLCITEGDISRVSDTENSDLLPCLPSIFAALQGIQMVIMYAPDAPLRKAAYEAMKRMLADVPNLQKPDMLKALVKLSNSPSMKAILLDCVSKELQREAKEGCEKGPFWTSVLELVELVLRPSEGRPPAFPEEIDAVSSALNLYRFVVIAESTGKTNSSGVLSQPSLRKAHTEWLLPLRTLVTGTLAEYRNNCDHHLHDVICGLNPVEQVLYRCIELVEEKL